MAQESVADIFSGKDEKQAAGAMYRLFSYLGQNPEQYGAIRQFLIENQDIDPEDIPPEMTPQQMNEVAQSLQAYSGEDGQGVGDLLAAKGRNGDSMVAHINPQEAQLLQSVGGSGTINPETGMPEFFLKKLWKRVVKPAIGGALGFLVGGPVGAVIGAGMGESSYQQSKAIKAGESAAAEQARLQQEAENNRRQEAMAEAERIRQAEIRRQENITAGAGEISSLFSQFNDDFYNKRAQNYLDYSLPQLDREYQDEQRSLIAQLARSGNLNSSLRGDLTGRLQGQYNTRKMGLQDTANKYAADARSQVEDARASLLQSNAQLADPGSIRTMAQARASGVAVDPRYESLGDMISSLSVDMPRGTGGAQTASGGVQLYSPSARGSGRLVG